jgi:hypothetical protein
MAFDATDLASIETAIRAIITGDRVVSVTFSDGKKVDYQKTDLEALKTMRSQINAEISATAGTAQRYAYPKMRRGY